MTLELVEAKDSYPKVELGWLTNYENEEGNNTYQWIPEIYDEFCASGSAYRVQFTCDPTTTIRYYSSEFHLNVTSKTECDAGQYLVGVQCEPCKGEEQVLGVSPSMNPRVPVRAWR